MANTKDYPNADWDTATETTTEPRIVYPFQELGDTTGMIYERDFVQHREAYTPAALDTADPEVATAYLIEETIPRSVEANLVGFTRRFGTVPSTFTMYQFESYTFPGYYENYTGPVFRPPLPKMIGVETTRTFLLTDDPLTDFALTGDPFRITHGVTEDYIDYVDGDSAPTYLTYSGYVSGSTAIQIRDNHFERAYGVGNIWAQFRFRSPAQ